MPSLPSKWHHTFVIPEWMRPFSGKWDDCFQIDDHLIHWSLCVSAHLGPNSSVVKEGELGTLLQGDFLVHLDWGRFHCIQMTRKTIKHKSTEQYIGSFPNTYPELRTFVHCYVMWNLHHYSSKPLFWKGRNYLYQIMQILVYPFEMDQVMLSNPGRCGSHSSFRNGLFEVYRYKRNLLQLNFLHWKWPNTSLKTSPEGYPVRG